MSDDVKKAVEDLRYIASQFGLKTVGEPPFVVRIKDLRAVLEERDALLAHIDAERERSKKVFAEGVATGRARFLAELKALLEVK